MVTGDFPVVDFAGDPDLGGEHQSGDTFEGLREGQQFGFGASLEFGGDDAVHGGARGSGMGFRCLQHLRDFHI